MANRSPAQRGIETSHAPLAPPAVFDVTALLEASRPTLFAAAEMNGRLYQTMAALNTEYIGFINRRLKEDLAIPQQFAACRTMEDIYNVYTGFFQRAVEHYRGEMEQFARLGQTMADNALSQVPEPAGKERSGARMSSR